MVNIKDKDIRFSGKLEFEEPLKDSLLPLQDTLMKARVCSESRDVFDS